MKSLFVLAAMVAALTCPVFGQEKYGSGEAPADVIVTPDQPTGVSPCARIDGDGNPIVIVKKGDKGETGEPGHDGQNGHRGQTGRTGACGPQGPGPSDAQIDAGISRAGFGKKIEAETDARRNADLAEEKARKSADSDEAKSREAQDYTLAQNFMEERKLREQQQRETIELVIAGLLAAVCLAMLVVAATR